MKTEEIRRTLNQVPSGVEVFIRGPEGKDLPVKEVQLIGNALVIKSQTDNKRKLREAEAVEVLGE